jgi:hypothetical protein
MEIKLCGQCSFCFYNPITQEYLCQSRKEFDFINGGQCYPVCREERDSKDEKCCGLEAKKFKQKCTE